MSAGKSAKSLIDKYVKSRTFAQEIQKTVAADKRLQEVRYGEFADDGVIQNRYLNVGVGANILPQSFAEFESFEEGAYPRGSFPFLNPQIVSVENKKWLQVTAKPDTTTWNYLWTDAAGKSFFKFSPISSRAILSFTLRRVNPGKSVWVRQRWIVADDANGTNPVTWFTTAWSYADDAAPGGTFYTWGNAHSTKKYIRPEIQIWGEVDDGTHVGQLNYFMWELVSDSKTEPSKYVGPTPRTGDIGLGQLTSGAGKNLLPYDQATFSPYGDMTNYVVRTNSVDVVMGDISDDPIGNGKAFFPTSDNTYRWTHNQVTQHRNTKNLKPNTWYMVSADTVDRWGHNATVAYEYAYDMQMRVRLAASPDNMPWVTSALANNANFNTATISTVGESEKVRVSRAILSGVSYSVNGKKIFVKFKTGPERFQGMRIDTRSEFISGSGGVVSTDRYGGLANYQLEEILESRTEPRPYVTPDIGAGQQSLQEQEIRPYVYLSKHTSIGSGTNQTVGQNTTAVVVFQWSSTRGRGGIGDAANNALKLTRPGLWELGMTLHIGNASAVVNWNFWVDKINPSNNLVMERIYMPGIASDRGSMTLSGHSHVVLDANNTTEWIFKLYANNATGAARDLLMPPDTDSYSRHRFWAIYLGASDWSST